MPSPRHTRAVLLTSAALLGAAVPAFAAHGADDPAGHDTTSTTGTTTTVTTVPSAPAAGSTRARAVAAAQAAVAEPTTLVRVRRKGDHRGASAVAWEVRLRGAKTRYDVRLDRDLGVLRVKRERLAPAAPGSDDGTPDQGSGNARATAGTTATTTATTTPAAPTGGSDDPAGHDAGDAHGDDAAGHDAGDDHGAHVEAGDDHGSHAEAGDDHGGGGAGHGGHHGGGEAGHGGDD